MPATNTLLTINMITAKALAILHQKCNIIGSVNRQYDDSFANTGAKIGSTLRIRLPVQYTVSTTPALWLQNTVETQVSLPITNQYHVDFSFSIAELTLSIDDFSARYIEPAIAVLAAQIEATFVGMMWPTVWNQWARLASAQSFKNVLHGPQAAARQPDAAVESNGSFASTPRITWIWWTNSRACFSSPRRSPGNTPMASWASPAGFEWAENTHLTHPDARRRERDLYDSHHHGSEHRRHARRHHRHRARVTPGDMFTVAGVFRVHPGNQGQQRRPAAVRADGGLRRRRRQYVHRARHQRRDRQPAAKRRRARANATAALTFMGTASTATGLSLAYAPDAFTFATADLVLPGGVDMAARVVKDGICMRAVRQYSISDDTMPIRIDVLWGAVALRPQLAVRFAAN